MKYIFQFAIIGAVTFAAEIIHAFIPLPIPAGIYGLIIMLMLLILKIIKAEWISETAKYLIAVMPVMFIPAGAKLITVADDVLPVIIPIIVILISTTIIVMAVAGKVTQFIIDKADKNDK